MNDQSITRREFVASSLAVVSPALVMKKHSTPNRTDVLTIQQVIDKIKAQIPMAMSGGTVDTPKSGDTTQPVTGIVTTMFATIDVIRQAIELKANLIIAHEPIFYNHHDETDWIKDHEVYQYKRELLERNKIVVWRFHDYWHSVRPDGVLKGVLNKLEWSEYYNPVDPMLLTIPAASLGEIIQHTKSRLGVQTLRFIGDSQDVCSRILLIPGAAGGRVHITRMQQYNPDLLICGEVQEWETSEYVRDYRLMGKKRSLLVLGHVLSEQPGMEYLVEWLKPLFPELRATHVPSLNPFTYG